MNMNLVAQFLLSGAFFSGARGALTGYPVNYRTQADNQYHIVQPGESLWIISRKYGLSLDELIALNPQIENPDVIFPGQSVRIRVGEEDTGPSRYEEQVVEIVNRERTSRGHNPLRINPQVMRVARRKSEDMRDNNYFSHQSPTYGSPFDMLKHFGVEFSSAAENIARGQRTPDAVVRAWMNSSGHRVNILNPYFTEIGVGYANGETPYWTQMFIRP